MRLFYLINEPYPYYQAGYRDAIKNLINKDELEDCLFYPFDVKCYQFHNNWKMVIEDILKEIANFKPSAILFAHTGTRYFDNHFFESIKKLLGYKPVYALDERDAYGKFTKKLPLQLLHLSAKCDITFLVTSGGWMFERFIKYAGASKVIFLPHVCDDFYFKDIPVKNNLAKKYDVVMIGNLLKSKIPFNSMPGVNERITVAKKLYERYGNRFAVFGSGWSGYPFSAGVVPYYKQDTILRESNLSVGVDHFFSYKQYFSDRLPISLFSGTPHLTLHTPNIDLLFKKEEHVFYFNNKEELIQQSDKILSGNVKKIDNIITNAKELIKNQYTEKIRMFTLINYLKTIAETAK